MKLGLQGTTVVWSSGDTGVTPEGQACLGDSQQIFSVDDPAGCPYALSVGATILPKGRKPGDAEAVTESFSPGGGFSNIFPAPDYQAAALDTFFTAHDPGFPSYNATDLNIPLSGDGVYNRAGRGYPDVSAVGDFGVFAFNGQVGLNAGTSMSAPIIAAMLTRVNEERLAAGKTPVGFVNPALYKKPDALRDVTEGRMRTDAPYSCHGKSYSATPGWDPVTGLGVPDYKAMSAYLNGLP
ncbi:Peptidase S8/S53, subtilisin/kexin/sedolisin [Cordyceps fumosorosea ARSEF 2679]|uniref:Peptidase S8/S53, subtilisin/kexin/sedolisin n=1 Tax=Cordyceps fumosorosea (strain ARSEF 2679) TaxID=1081104 RepID=A0A168ELL5_CORFA|nr:Peptidase S8/S53, subtilisin/kexin/sedolisin [Cordyceps fumosorosea ARSEF 2679]OAA73957.1 Peptidase S8/S53, subtilisin/kexin/sedolisin [Cordyceps fumosorosea ARSEF 2679]